MPAPLDLLSPTDRPALLCVSQPECVDAATSALTNLGYKNHVASDHADAATRFSQAQYQVVIVEETFAGATLPQNSILQALQRMPMSQRRHAVLVLIGDSFQTLDALQAFQQSVHAVVRRSDISSLQQILQKVIGENDLFLAVYRESQTRIAAG